MRQGNVFNNRNTLFNKKRKVGVSFLKGLNSIDLDDIHFTNFCSSKECNEYKMIKEYYERTLKHDYDFLEEDFVEREYTRFNKVKNERLAKLISLTINQDIATSDLIDIVKYKNRDKKGIQFFIKYSNSSDSGEVYLIDLHHMALPTENRSLGQKKPNSALYYSRVSRKVKHKVNLSEIKL